MLGFQFAIGAANDFEDAAADSVSKAGKPDACRPRCPPGRCASLRRSPPVPGWSSRLWSGLPALVVGAVGLGDGPRVRPSTQGHGSGLGAVRGRRRTAAGVCLVRSRGRGCRRRCAGVVVLAFIAGSTLALANAYADVYRDRAASAISVATLLGPERTLVVDAALLACVQIVALATTIATAEAAPLLTGSGWLRPGLARGWPGRRPRRRARPLVWEVQAIGFSRSSGVAWLAGSRLGRTASRLSPPRAAPTAERARRRRGLLV